MRVLRWAGHLWTGVLVIIVVLAALLLGLRLLLPLLSAPPTLLDATPGNGAEGVSPRMSLVLRFNAPMNPRSVEQALALSPAVPWQPLWSDAGATLTISPTQNLRPDTSYHLTLDTSALSRRFRALEQPLDLRFRTAPAPAVVRVLPADGAGNVSLTMPISIQFSRTIVPTTALMLPTQLPELLFDPPITGTVTWLDPATALFRPAAPLRPGTRYRATLAAALSDLAGTPLNSPFDWTFSTPAPAVLAVAPADGASGIAPRATLAITLSQPLDLDSVRATLAITPALTGDLSATSLPDGRQVILYAPFAGWQPATTYAITLQASAAPVGGNLPLAAPRRWSFSTAPLPALTGRFPGEGQTLPPGQEIRLVFNTPMDGEAIRKAIQFSPPAGVVQVTASASDVRITADVRAATTYTITLPMTLPDRNGIPLGHAYQLRFVTASAGPALVLPEAPDHVAQTLPGQPAALLIQRTNLSALNFDLYKLDEAAVVRTLGFIEGDWELFQPERYAQPLLRSWSTPLSDQLNAPATDRVPVTAADGTPLPVGAYYLRIRTPEGPRADLLLLVSRTRLTLQASAGATLIWATDVISGTPRVGLPITLYQAGVLTQQGTTDADGLLRFGRSAGTAQSVSVALAGDDPSGAVSSAWATTGVAKPDTNYVFLTSDRAIYQPGERVELAGVARATAAPSGTLALPQDDAISISVRPPDDASPIYQTQSDLRDTGIFSAGLTLPPDAPPGQYSVAATIDEQTFQTTFIVAPAGPALLQVTVNTPPPLAAGEPMSAQVEVRTPQGLPVAGAAISWTLDIARAPFPAIDDYVFGDDERAPVALPGRSGTGQADDQGRFSVVISDTVVGDMPLKYRILVQASEPGGLGAAATGAFLVAPAPVAVGVRLPSRIFQVGAAGEIQLLAVSADGEPAPAANLRVEVYSRTWERIETVGSDSPLRVTWQPRDTLSFSRNAVSGADGTVSLPLTLTGAGVYRLHVSTSDAAGQATFSAISLWASAPGFVDWGELPGGQPLLIADQVSYRPGETATLLLTAPFTQSSVLITRGGAEGIAGQTRVIRAGEPFTVTLQPEDVPALRLAVLFAGRSALAADAAAPPPPLLATATLSVLPAPPPLAVDITSNATSYAPGATATLTITTVDASGVGVPADLIVGITGASAVPRGSIADAFRPAAPSLATAPARATAAITTTATPPDADRDLQPAPAASVYWSSALRTNADGVLTLTVKLPSDPAELRALVWAAGASSFAQGQTTLAITLPLALQVDAPPFFRVGDQVELAARVQNTSPSAQNIQASLASAGITLEAGSAITQRLVVVPGGSARFVWRARVLNVAGVSLSVTAGTGGDQSQSAQIDQPILPAGPALDRSGGALVQGRFTQIFTTSLASGDAGQIRLDLTASSAALTSATARALAAVSERSLLDEASLLLMTAPLSDTQVIARAARDRLLAGQNDDGGWSWWPGGQTEPFATAVALEAIAEARTAGIALPPVAVDRGLARLQLALHTTGTSADARAHMLYTLTLFDKADAPTLSDLTANPSALSPTGLAYLLLARATQPDQASDPVLDRLTALAQHQGDLVFWPARLDGVTLDSDVSATALALLALERAQPSSDLAAGARRWLAAASPTNGYERVRMLAALRASDPPAAATTGRYTVALNGGQLLDQPLTDVLSSTRTLRLPLDAAHARNELAVSSDSPIFLRYRLSTPAPSTPARAGGITLLREYLDPITGQPLDLAKLRAGQLLRVRLTIVTATSQRFLAVTDALPAGAVVVATPASAAFAYIGRTPDHLTLASVTAQPGIYQYSYLLRVVAAGRYAVPAPTASAALGVTGSGNAAMVEVAAR